ncbi:unnamed protein product [Coccothraustes coccothraustes]
MSPVVGGDPTAGRRTNRGALPERGWRRGRGHLCTGGQRERSGPAARREAVRVEAEKDDSFAFFSLLSVQQ